MDIEKQIRNYRNEVLRLIKLNGYTKTDVVSENKPKSFYFWEGLNVVSSKNLSFHIVNKGSDLGLGRFVTCVVRNGRCEMVGTDIPEFFFPVLFQFLNGEITESEAIDKVIG